MKAPNQTLSQYGTTVFEVMSRLAVAHEAVNLGQGFPDEEGPESMLQAVDDAGRRYPNQYPPMLGVPELRQAVADHGKRFYGLEVDWQRQVMVTSGATEALAASILALIEPGDEAIVFEPLYDSYMPMLQRAGADVKRVRLSPPDWALPVDELAAAFSSRTKLVLLNTPMNPTGKVFTRQELQSVADLLERHDAYAICDEVYEHLIFDNQAHIPLITLPGMAERAIRIGSAGKTFSMTGWKVGYATAAPELLAYIAKAHQFLVFTTPPNLQRAVAHGLNNEEDWYTALAPALQVKRDYLSTRLNAIGFEVVPTRSTYFMNADIRPLGLNVDDEAFCKRIVQEAGVAIVPVSALFVDGDIRHLVRFCFCKKMEILDAALERLESYFGTRA